MDAYNLIWNALQQVQIGYATRTAEGAQKLARHQQVATREEFRLLEERLARLTLICKGAFELLLESGGVTERQVAERILEVDLRDGKADGRVTPRPKRCPKCGAGICAKFGRCLFCGHVDASGDVFNAV